MNDDKLKAEYLNELRKLQEKYERDKKKIDEVHSEEVFDVFAPQQTAIDIPEGVFDIKKNGRKIRVLLSDVSASKVPKSELIKLFNRKKRIIGGEL